MTIEKLEDREWYLPDVTAKINEIIDYLNSKDHIVEKHEMVESQEVFPDTGKKVESNRGADLTPVPPVTSTI